jgi:hypothetical protein
LVEGAASTILTPIALDWILDQTSLDRLGDELAEDQTTREFTLSHFVPLRRDLACGTRPAPRAAFLKRQLGPVASIAAFYRKLARREVAVTAAVVRQTAARAPELIGAAGGLGPELIQGYAPRSRDGQILTAAEHRIEPLRSTRSAAWPGRSWAVSEPASSLSRHLGLAETAHA